MLYYHLIVIVNAISVVQRRIDRSSHWKFSIKKVFLQISQNSWENTCARVSSLRDSITGFFLCFFLWGIAFAFRTTSNIHYRTFLSK